jgi:hypothetical protein
MTDKKISELTAASSCTGADGMAIVQSGTTKELLLSALATYMQTAGLPTQSGHNGEYLTTNGTTASWAGVPYDFIVACSDQSTALATGTAKVTFRMPRAMTLTSVKASLNTAGTGSVTTFDINKNGTSILSTKLTIDISEETSATAATPAVLSSTTLAADDEITVDFDTVGTGAKGAVIYLVGKTP